MNEIKCPKCGEIYNIKYHPPKVEGICDVCNSPLYTRADDNEETVKVRLSVYNEQTKPLVEYYEALNKIISSFFNIIPYCHFFTLFLKSPFLYIINHYLVIFKAFLRRHLYYTRQI